VLGSCKHGSVCFTSLRLSCCILSPQISPSLSNSFPRILSDGNPELFPHRLLQNGHNNSNLAAAGLVRFYCFATRLVEMAKASQSRTSYRMDVNFCVADHTPALLPRLRRHGAFPPLPHSMAWNNFAFCLKQYEEITSPRDETSGVTTGWRGWQNVKGPQPLNLKHQKYSFLQILIL
jgi:hypothetical protein